VCAPLFCILLYCFGSDLDLDLRTGIPRRIGLKEKVVK
jgi:hypothetical protein